MAVVDRLIEVAKAVVAELNSPAVGTTWSQTFTAKRVARPKWDRKELASLVVAVHPVAQQVQFVVRDKDAFTSQIDVAILKQADPDDLATVDPLSLLACEFMTYFRARTLATWAAVCTGRERTEPWDIDQLDQNRVVMCVTRLTFLEHA